MIRSVSNIRSVGSISQSTQGDLQTAIDANHTSEAIALLKNGLANQPLPNGHMPLNYAIRHGKLELVEAMLKEIKLQTQEKDFQGLTAVDHALITRDQKMIAVVLGNIIGKEFDAATTRTFDPTEIRKIGQLLAEIRLMRTGISSSNPLHEAARKGDLAEVKKLYNFSSPNSYDKNGFAPLHYAALAGKKEIVEWLLQNGERADILTRSGCPLLLFACIGGHTDLISYLIQTQKANPNATDPIGRFCLYYAMTFEDLSVAKVLIRNGANPFLKAEGLNFSPVELMLNFAKERSDSRDPLALSSNEVVMFLGIVAPWVSRVCGYNGEDQYDLYLDVLLPLLGGISAFEQAYKSLKTPKAVAAYWGTQMGMVVAAGALLTRIFYTGDTTGARFLLGLGFANTAWHAYQIGKNALNGLGNCWSNRSLETYRPIRNAIVHSVIGANVANHVSKAVTYTLKGMDLLDAWDAKMEIEGDTFRNLKTECKEEEVCFPYGVGCIKMISCTSEEAQREAFINNFLFKYMNGKDATPPPTSSFQSTNDSCYFDPKLCEGKTDLECILNLNPRVEGISCHNQAQKILDLSGESRCKKAFRALSVKYHPDKCLDKKLCQSAILKIQEAADVQNCLKN